MSRTRVKQLLQLGRVAVYGTSVTQFDHPLRPGDRVEVLRERPGPDCPAGLPIVFADEHLIVVDKPAGLLSVATDAEKTETAFARLRAWLRQRRQGRPFVVHRLDRDTSGLLLFSRAADGRDRLHAAWDRVTKTYLAVVEGTPAAADGMIENYLTEGRDLRVRITRPDRDAKRALTRYRVVRTFGTCSLLEVELETGRKHQIRVHLAGLGCPIIGDATYGAKSDPAGRLGLHAWRLVLNHPVSGRRLEWESPLPAALQRVISR
jgi:23S rRNA pseudouridine1911/1915/1917 synthase